MCRFSACQKIDATKVVLVFPAENKPMTSSDSPRIPKTFYISNNIENYKNVCIRNGNVIQTGVTIEIADVFNFNIPNTRNYCMGEVITQIRVRRSSLTSAGRFAGTIDILYVYVNTYKMAYDKEPYLSNYVHELQHTSVSETQFSDEYVTIFEKLRDRLVLLLNDK